MRDLWPINQPCRPQSPQLTACGIARPLELQVPVKLCSDVKWMRDGRASLKRASRSGARCRSHRQELKIPTGGGSVSGHFEGGSRFADQAVDDSPLTSHLQLQSGHHHAVAGCADGLQTADCVRRQQDGELQQATA